MKILVTGCNGQLGHCLQDISLKDEYKDFTFEFTDVQELDICNFEALESYISGNTPDVLINAAAYTAVDNAEDDVDNAYLLNRDAVNNLAILSQKYGMHLIHISTDYVFSGTSCNPYRPTDAIAPQSIYGKSKAEGEEAIRRSGCKATIIRTSWLYSEYGKNFVKTMLRLGEERDELNVVYDQIGGPTYAGDLAAAIMAVVTGKRQEEKMKIYHFANQGVTSWYDFTKAIMDISGIRCKVSPILSSEYPAKAPRPAYSVFNLADIKEELRIEIPYWKDSLKLVINKLRG